MTEIGPPVLQIADLTLLDASSATACVRVVRHGSHKSEIVAGFKVIARSAAQRWGLESIVSDDSCIPPKVVIQ
jgi:hypothetical protein